MPTYDYQCDSCGHKYELYQSIMAKPVSKCPSCGRRTAKRLIGAGASIIFKGSGFYQTDYRSDGYKKAAKADADAQSAGKKDKTTDAKPSAESKQKATDAA